MAGAQDEPVAIGPVRDASARGAGTASTGRTPSGPRPSGRPGARSSPSGRHRSRASGSCRSRGGRGRASRRSWVGSDGTGVVVGELASWVVIVGRGSALRPRRYHRGHASTAAARPTSPRPTAPPARPSDGRPAADRRPRRPDARCRPRAGTGRSRRAPTSPAGSRWSRAARRRPPPAGSAGSGAQTTLIAAVGRDAAGRALVEAVRGRRGHAAGAPRRRGADRPDRRARRARRRAAFVADRGAADLLRPDDLRAAWFAGADALHLPAYSLHRRAARARRPAGHRARPRRRRHRQRGSRLDRAAARRGPPRRPDARSQDVAPGPAVRDRGRGGGAARAATPSRGCSTTPDRPSSSAGPRAPRCSPWTAGASSASRSRPSTSRRPTRPAPGDAFDAGFLVGWFAARAAGRSTAASLQRAALAGHRAAARQLTTPRPELASPEAGQARR